MPRNTIIFWQREWPVIRQAPVSFVLLLLVAVAVSWSVVWYLTSERMEALNARNDLLSDRIQALEVALSRVQNGPTPASKKSTTIESEDEKPSTNEPTVSRVLSNDIVRPGPLNDGRYWLAISAVQPIQLEAPTIAIRNVGDAPIEVVPEIRTVG